MQELLSKIENRGTAFARNFFIIQNSLKISEKEFFDEFKVCFIFLSPNTVLKSIS